MNCNVLGCPYIQQEIPVDFGMVPTHRQALVEKEVPHKIIATAPRMADEIIETNEKGKINQVTSTTNTIENHSYNTMI